MEPTVVSVPVNKDMIRQFFKPTAETQFITRVRADTNVHGLAKSIHLALKKHTEVVLCVLGGGPTQQAVKAASIVSGRAHSEGKDLVARFTMVDEQQPDGKNLTIVRITLRYNTLKVLDSAPKMQIPKAP